MLLRTNNTTQTIKIRFLWGTISHFFILLNVLIVNIHPFIFWPSFEDQFWSFLWISLEVILRKWTFMKVFIECLIIITFVTLIFVDVEMFIFIALNAFLSSRKRCINRTFLIKWIFLHLLNLFLDFWISFFTGPVWIIKIWVIPFKLTMIG